MAVMASILFGGCQSSPQPRAPNLEVNNVLGHAGDKPTPSIGDIDKARKLVDGLINLLDKATEDRRDAQEVVNDSTFFGTLAAVAGVVGKSIAARNVGAGVAGIMSATGGHYQLDKQKAAFQKALSSAQCLRSALNGIDKEAFALFPNGDLGKDDKNDVDYNKLYAAVPGITYDRYVDIVNQLTTDLDGISTASGSLSDVQGVADAVRDAEKKANGVKTGSQSGIQKVADKQLMETDKEVAKAQAALAAAIDAQTQAQTQVALAKAQAAQAQADAVRVQAQADAAKAKAQDAQTQADDAKVKAEAAMVKTQAKGSQAKAQDAQARDAREKDALAKASNAQAQAQAQTLSEEARSLALAVKKKTDLADSKENVLQLANEQLNLEEQILKEAQAKQVTAAAAAAPSAEPKRTAFLLAVVGFSANAELCAKVTVNK